MAEISLVVLSKACFEGVNRTVYRLLQSQYGIPVHLIIPDRIEFSDGTREPADVPGEILQITKLRLLNRHSRLQVFNDAGSLVSKLKPSHILVDNDPASFMVLKAGRWAKQLNAKLWVITCENLERHYLKEALSGLISLHPKAFVGGVLNQVFSLLVKSSIDQVFTISQDGTRSMEAFGLRGRITQVPLGFDTAIFYEQNPAKIAAKKKQCEINQPTIAYFGRISSEKGVDLLIRALAKLTHERWQLLLDDFEGYRTPYINEILHLLESTGVEERTVFFKSDHSGIADYMNIADIVVLPSITTAKWKEQYGRVIPEAMACGKVVIASQSGTPPELIGDCGFLFPEGDISQLQALISKLLSMPHSDRTEIGSKASLRARSQLSANKQAEILFHRLVENR
jgi:glycosyltransferase involved in cell wall biosynthesis